MATELRSILFTDIVGYSRMMSADENLALKLLSEHDEILNKSIESSGGHVIKNVGDAFFAEFDSADDALGATLGFQLELQERNLTAGSAFCVLILQKHFLCSYLKYFNLGFTIVASRWTLCAAGLER